MSQLALQLIAKAKSSNAKILDLGNCGLTELPDELFELTALEELNLCNSYWDYKNRKRIKSKNQGNPNHLKALKKGIAKLKALKTLRINGEWNNRFQISDISFLENLTGLQTLNLGHNEISGIFILENLTGLQTLDLGHNEISDISILENLTDLQTLYLSHNYISDISFLEYLIDLQTLDLSLNKISDNSILENLTGLQMLGLGYNTISDIAFLEDLIGLQTLILSENKISDISILENLTGLQTLDLSGNKISDISILENLTGLQTLELNSNKISDISILENLTGLQTLELNSNKISDISILENLTGLQRLDLCFNQISDISILENLTGLQTLELNSNQISDISFLENLTGLQTLELNSNQISDISFLENLTGLQRLCLSSNQISDITPILGLINKGVPVVWAYNFENSIFLKNNPLKSPPPEIVQQGNTAILNWFAANKKALNELKLIFIGDPKAGKTSILRRLMDDSFVEGEEQTDGINIETLQFAELDTFKAYPALEKVRAYCWDFGGQETMNATHQFFMTKRCVYVLVLDARKDNQIARQVKNWVSRIAATGGDSSIIVVSNQIDVNPAFGFENENELKAEFPQIKYFLKTSCKKPEGIEDLKAHLTELIPKAKLFNTEIDERWFPVKEQLQKETGAGAKDFLNESRFKAICTQNKIIDEADRKELIYFLNDLGIILHFDNLNLAEYYVLDPYWLTYGIYQIVTSKYVAEKEGIIPINQVEYIINKEEGKAKAYKVKSYRKIEYSTNERRYLLDFLAEYKLAFKSHCGTQVIIPDVLSTEEPIKATEKIRAADHNIQFVYDYAYLPKSILPNFMADTNIMLSAYWRTGCVLNSGSESALVSVYDDRITLTVTGVHKQKREFLAVVRSYLENINNNQNQKPKRLIPLPNIKNGFANYDELLKREKRESIYYAYDPVEADFKISQLLEGIAKDDELERIRIMVKEEVENQKQNLNVEKPAFPKKKMPDIRKAHFKVAVSFPGEKRAYVEKTVQVLAALLRAENIFYDNWYKSQLAQPGIDTLLQNIYNKQCDLVVVFLCKEYNKKDWCGIEWRAVKDLINRKESNKIMLLTFDYEKIDGLYISTDGMLDLRIYNEQETANLIESRLNYL